MILLSAKALILKLVSCWHLSTRDAESAKCFIDDLASRLANRIQLTTKGNKAYLEAVEDAFGANVDSPNSSKFTVMPDKVEKIAAVIALLNILDRKLKLSKATHT